MNPVQQIYDAAPPEHRQTMLVMRERILDLLPGAQEVVSYGMPAFRVEGGIAAGLLANKAFVGYYPFSGSILGQFADELSSYKQTKSALHIPLGKPLSKAMLRRLLHARLKEIADMSAKKSSTRARRNAPAIPALPADSDAFWKSLGISAPARRALIGHGIATLVDLKGWTKADLSALHGMGPHALVRLEDAMKQAHVTFKRG